MERHWRRPKYLAQNFLASALHQRRSLLDNMLIVPPYHMETVDSSYVHRGWMTASHEGQCHYDRPWQWLLKMNHDMIGTLCFTVVDDTNSLCGDTCSKTLNKEFCDLTCDCLSNHCRLEGYELLAKKNSIFDNEEETRSDVDLFLLSQDIDSAIERFLPSSSPRNAHSSIPNGAHLPREEFLPAKLHDWDLTMCSENSFRDHVLEEPESPSHLSFLLALLPMADVLLGRLKPKLIQDPFLDDKGQPFTQQHFFSDDLKLDEDFVPETKKSTTKRLTTLSLTTQLHHFEHYCQDESISAENADCTDLDPILEMFINECVDNERGSEELLLATNRPQLPSPDKAFMDKLLLVEQSKGDTGGSIEDLWSLAGDSVVNPCSSTPSGFHGERAPQFSPAHNWTVKKKSDPVGFIKLNNHDVSHDSDDSGIGHALLESPLLPPPLSPPTATPLTRQLSRLEPFQLSPVQETVEILSPAHKKKVLLQLWQKDKVFDSVLALTLPYPDTEGDVLSDQLNTVDEALVKLNIKTLNLDGDAELELTWDPLGESCHEMIVTEQSLISKQPFHLGNIISFRRKRILSNKWMEHFQCDTWIKSVNDEGVEMPLTFHSMTTDSSRSTTSTTTTVPSLQQAQSDIPSLHVDPSYPPLPSGYRCKPSMATSNNLNTHLKTQSMESKISEDQHPDSKFSDPRATAWEILELSNSRVSSRNSSLQLNSSLYGLRRDKDSRVSGCLGRSVPRGCGQRSKLFASPVATIKDIDGDVGCFMMMRAPGSTPERKIETKVQNENGDDESQENEDDDGNDLELVWSETVVISPSILDVVLSGEYGAAVDKIEEHMSSLLTGCKSFGLVVPAQCSIREQFPADQVKFFLKEQQKMLEDNRTSERAGEVFQSCQLAAGLYIVGMVLDVLTHCSLSAAIGTFTSLAQKYGELLLHSSTEPVREQLSALQVAYREHKVDPHPKFGEMMKIVRSWKKSAKKSTKEKIVIVIAREFTALSGDILDFLQIIPGLKSCVFSFSSNGHSDPLYAKAIEERFLHYDCVVAPESSITSQRGFPWEKVTLLIEYEPLKQPLFDEEAHSDAQSAMETNDCDDERPSLGQLRLREYVTLKTAINKPTDSASMELCHYKLIGSENVTNNNQLLKLLETRYNTEIVERDYYSNFNQRSSVGRGKMTYADLILDQSVGILLKPISQLSSDAGLKVLISSTTALSFQFEACWVLLYTEDDQQYPFSGSTPTNLARLHASVSHYSREVDCYQVKILIASGMDEVAQLVRKITEDIHTNTKVWNTDKWLERSWLSEEMTEREKVLLRFPCLNSFSAQLMLCQFTLSDLLAMNLEQLQNNLPWLSAKVIKLFHKLCHFNAIDNFGTDGNQENRDYDSTCTSADCDLTRVGTSMKPTLTCQSFQTSDTPIQHNKSSTLKCKSNHVRFNVYDLPSGKNIDHGCNFEEANNLNDVIVLSSDDEQPPGPKRAKLHSTNTFPLAEKSDYYTQTDDLDTRVIFTSPQLECQGLLNDSLEEFEIQYPPECPIVTNDHTSEVEGQTVSMNQQNPLALAGRQPMAHFNQRESIVQEQHQSYGIYRDFNCSAVNNRGAGSGQACASTESLFNLSVIETTITSNPNSSNSAVNLLKSASWEGKTPTQKQIRQSVMNSISRIDPKPGFHDPFPAPNNHVTNTARMAREYFTGDPPPGFMAGAVVRKASPPSTGGDRTVLNSVERTPLKSLSLGNEDRKTIRLQSDDRSITSGSQCHDPIPNHNNTHASNALSVASHQWQKSAAASGGYANLHSLRISSQNQSTIERNYPSTSSILSNESGQSSIGRFSDLKAFHQLQHSQPPSDKASFSALPPMMSDYDVARKVSGNYNSGSEQTAKSHFFNDPLMGRGVIGPTIRAKRPHPGMARPSNSHSLTADGLVPSTSIISPTTTIDSSLFESPNTSTNSIRLSPLRKRRLAYQRDPANSDGQTKLHFC